MKIKTLIIFLLSVNIFALKAENKGYERPPGIIIDHIPSKEGKYIGSPSICILPNGSYIASHDEFGPKSKEYQSAITSIFISSDRGETWEQISTINGQFWSTLFIYQGDLYIMGTNKHHGNLVLRKSTDGGKKWTVPYNSKNGLILEGEYHTAPVPVLFHNGRIWRTVEYATARTVRWGERYSAAMVSAPIGCDIMDASNWTRSNHLEFNKDYLDGDFKAWLEGNAVVDPKGKVVNVLRVGLPEGREEHAAIIDCSDDGKILTFDAHHFIKMPGAAKKFSIRYDDKTQRYWTLINYVPKGLYPDLTPDKVRNHLAVATSADLKKWTVNEIALSHPDQKNHGFQYVDWVFDGEDIIFVSRTAYDEEDGQARNNHDANYLTFHRIRNYKNSLMKTVE